MRTREIFLELIIIIFLCSGLSFQSWTILRRCPVRWWVTSCTIRSVETRDPTGAHDDIISRQITSSPWHSYSSLSSSLFHGRCCTSLSSSPSVILAQTRINYFWYFPTCSVWSSTLHVPASRPCQGLEEKSPHRCHVRHFPHWQFSDLPGCFYYLVWV